MRCGTGIGERLQRDWRTIEAILTRWGESGRPREYGRKGHNRGQLPVYLSAPFAARDLNSIPTPTLSNRRLAREITSGQVGRECL